MSNRLAEHEQARRHCCNGKQQQQARARTEWKVHASDVALNTSNPIREIIETMNLAENPSKKVIPLSIGDPTIFGNLKPCKEILDALQRANSCGKFYGYQVAAGMESAREAVADYHFRCTGNRVKVQPAHNLLAKISIAAEIAREARQLIKVNAHSPQDVILASGCSHAIDLSICVLAKQGQNILIPRPGFPLYKTLTSIYGVHFKQYNLLADKNWSVDLRHLESLIDERTAAIVINNPSNPCGSVFSRRHLLQILELAERRRLPIIADEIYDKFVFAPAPEQRRRRPSQAAERALAEQELDGEQQKQQQQQQHEGQQAQQEEDENREPAGAQSEQQQQQQQQVPFIALSKLSETVPILTCGGISKTCLIPGLRLGWIIINDRKSIFDSSVRNGLNRLTQRLMGPNSLVQGALRDILNSVPESFYAQTMEFIYLNARLCCERLRQVRGLKPHMPQGSMYLMVKFDAKLFPTIDGDLDFTSKLMNEESVLVLPGKCFDFPDYFRLCLTVPTNVMEEALSRISQFCERHAQDCQSAPMSLVAQAAQQQILKHQPVKLAKHDSTTRIGQDQQQQG